MTTTTTTTIAPDAELEAFIDGALKMYNMRNGDVGNPIVLQYTILNNIFRVVVSVNEPGTVSLPFNVIWICADTNFKDSNADTVANLHVNMYRLVLRRFNWNQDTTYPLVNNWIKIAKYESLFSVTQSYIMDSRNFLLGELESGIAYPPASLTKFGLTKLKAIDANGGTLLNPSLGDEIAVGDNDVKMTNARDVVSAHSSNPNSHPLEPCTQFKTQNGSISVSTGALPEMGQVLMVVGNKALWKTLTSDMIPAATIASITITGGPSGGTMPEGTSTQFNCTATYTSADGNFTNIIYPTTWSLSSSSSVLTTADAIIDANGLLTAKPIITNPNTSPTKTISVYVTVDTMTVFKSVTISNLLVYNGVTLTSNPATTTGLRKGQHIDFTLTANFDYGPANVTVNANTTFDIMERIDGTINPDIAYTWTDVSGKKQLKITGTPSNFATFNLTVVASYTQGLETKSVNRLVTIDTQAEVLDTIAIVPVVADGKSGGLDSTVYDIFEDATRDFQIVATYLHSSNPSRIIPYNSTNPLVTWSWSDGSGGTADYATFEDANVGTCKARFINGVQRQGIITATLGTKSTTMVVDLLNNPVTSIEIVGPTNVVERSPNATLQYTAVATLSSGNVAITAANGGVWSIDPPLPTSGTGTTFDASTATIVAGQISSDSTYTLTCTFRGATKSQAVTVKNDVVTALTVSRNIGTGANVVVGVTAEYIASATWLSGFVDASGNNISNSSNVVWGAYSSASIDVETIFTNGTSQGVVTKVNGTPDKATFVVPNLSNGTDIKIVARYTLGGTIYCTSFVLLNVNNTGTTTTTTTAAVVTAPKIYYGASLANESQGISDADVGIFVKKLTPSYALSGTDFTIRAASSDTGNVYNANQNKFIYFAIREFSIGEGGIHLANTTVLSNALDILAPVVGRNFPTTVLTIREIPSNSLLTWLGAGEFPDTSLPTNTDSFGRKVIIDGISYWVFRTDYSSFAGATPYVINISWT